MSQFEKWVKLNKWVTLRQMAKPHLEKGATVRKMGHTYRNMDHT